MTDLKRINTHLAQGGRIRVEGKGEAQRLVTMNRVTAAVRSIFVNDLKQVTNYIISNPTLRNDSLFREHFNSGKRHVSSGALHAALLEMDELQAMKLIQQDPTLLRDTDDRGETPLHYMSRLGMHDLIVKFSEHLDVKALLRRSSKGESPLHAAIEGGNNRTIKLLLDKLAELSPSSLKAKESNGPGKKSLGHYIAASDDVQILEHAVKLGIPFNFTDVNGQYPLHIATQTNNAEFVQLIHLRHREAVREKDDEGNTPVDIAMQTGKFLVAIELLKGDFAVNSLREESVLSLQTASISDPSRSELIGQLSTKGYDFRRLQR